MKNFIRRDPSITNIQKRVLWIISFVFIIVIVSHISSCIKEDYPVRLVFPVLTTTAVTDTTSTTATSGGNITDDGGKEITARGICWTLTADNPVVAAPDSTTVDGTGIGQFVSNLDGLLPDTTYHVRAYATNAEGTAYGQTLTFKTKPN